jgi:folate-binding protein YgfZ
MDEKQAVISLLTKAGLPPATPEDARIVRIENGRPRYGEEITERYLVQETDQLRAVHFSKGCYLGQEIVERVRSRAQIHRVLRRLEIDTSQPPEAGTKLKSGDADAAEIASAVFSPALGKTVALAYVRTQFAEPGTKIVLDGISGIVT